MRGRLLKNLLSMAVIIACLINACFAKEDGNVGAKDEVDIARIKIILKMERSNCDFRRSDQGVITMCLIEPIQNIKDKLKGTTESMSDEDLRMIYYLCGYVRTYYEGKSLSDEDYYYACGMVDGYAGNYEEAVKEFSKVLAINPQRAEAYFNRAMMNYAIGNSDLAEKDSAQAILLAPRQYTGFENIGGCLENWRDMNHQYAEKKAVYYMEKVYCGSSYKEYSEAVKLYDAADLIKVFDADMYKDEPEKYIYRVKAYLSVGRYKDALRVADMGLAVCGKDYNDRSFTYRYAVDELAALRKLAHTAVDYIE